MINDKTGPTPHSLLPTPYSLLPTPHSLYIHIPFCAGGKCDYCDFFSVPVNAGDRVLEVFVDTLLSEAERLFKACPVKEIPSIYIGGGTPSLLGSTGIERLLSGLLKLTDQFSPRPDEITVEANPESTDESFLAAAREGGATRLSLGIQTFNEASRQAVNRPSINNAHLHEKLDLAGEYFPLSFSADLLSGLPFQSGEVLADDIAALLSHKPSHVSLYALTEEPGTALALKRAAGKLRLPGSDEADELWLKGRNMLLKAGYGQYEVSNFCIPGKESIHNIRYWRMQDWLALGPSASGTLVDGGCRYTIPPDTGAWLSAGGCVFSAEPGLSPEYEKLDTSALIRETLLMGFRYIKGPDEALFRRRFNKSLSDLIPKTLGAWRQRSLLQQDKCALTGEGLLFLNRFLVEAFKELDALAST